MEARPTPDSYGTFLKALQSHGVSEQEARQDPQLSPDMLGDSLKILAKPGRHRLPSDIRVT
jgi:hypothetical protein